MAEVVKSLDMVDRSTPGSGCPFGFVKYTLLTIRFLGKGVSLLLGLAFPGMDMVLSPWVVHHVVGVVTWNSTGKHTPASDADNLQCNGGCSPALLHAAQFASRFVRLVGHEVTPFKCVLLSTSVAVRKSMKSRDTSPEGSGWS